MAREGGAVTGIVRGIVHRLDVREAGEIHKAGAEDRRTRGGGQALSQGRGAAGGALVCVAAGAADDRHAFLKSRTGAGAWPSSVTTMDATAAPAMRVTNGISWWTFFI